MRLNKFQIIGLLIFLSFEGCSLIPRNLREYDSNVKKITFVSPMGADLRAPNGASIYLFRSIMLRKSAMVGAGVEFAQVMLMRDSEIFVSLLAPYIYYSPVGIV